MALGDIFKSEKQRKKEERMRRRKALREAEGAVDKIKDRIDGMKKERDASWAEARDYLKAGQKEAAQRCLQSVRGHELLMSQLEKKHWVSRQLIVRMETAGIDQEIASSFAVLNKVLDIDPEKLSETLDDVREALGEQDDIEKMWDRMYEKDMAGIDRVSDSIPSIEEMMKNLEDEATAEVGSYRVADGDAEDISGKIGEGREKLNKLLEKDK